jgi:hypothetical protein
VRGRTTRGKRDTTPRTALAWRWTLTMLTLHPLPQLLFILANSTQGLLRPTIRRPHMHPRFTPPLHSTQFRKAMGIRPTLRLLRSTLHSPRPPVTGTPRSLRLPLPGHMPRMPVPLSMGQTTKPQEVMPPPVRTGFHQPCLMCLPLPQGLTVLPLPARRSMGQRQILTATLRLRGILRLRASRQMVSTAAVRILQQQPAIPRLRLMF